MIHFPVFQVDAKVFYAEAGLEIRGEWRTADGTTGTLSGTKALAGLALGGSKLFQMLMKHKGNKHEKSSCYLLDIELREADVVVFFWGP